MGFLGQFKQLYSLDTLDTRFTISATTPPKAAASELRIDPAKPSPSKSGESSIVAPLPNAQPSLWRTPEFYFYYFCFVTIVPLMLKTGYDVSRSDHPGYPAYSHLLSDGWIPGRKVDNSDSQYSGFRDHFLHLAPLLIVHPLLRKAYESFWRSSTYTDAPSTTPKARDGLTMGLPSSVAADTRLSHRLSFDFGFGLLYISALYGFSVLKIFVILYANYKIATNVPKSYMPAATWIFNIITLFANESSRGYPYAWLASKVFNAGPASPLFVWGEWLDAHGGLTPRWEVLFNITVLRLISFNLDYYWSLSMRGGSPIEVRRDICPSVRFMEFRANSPKKKQLDPANLSERDRVGTPAKPQDYTFRNYIAYALYSPLFLAGPILTFNDYISQSRYRAASITKSRTTRYALRFFICMLTMELCIHYIYVVAIFDSKPDWALYSPMELSLLGYFNLNHIWLKLLIPWRFFRLWSLLDGIDPPENMVRCMSDNYSALAFWRGWHRSYNRWIVRYIYVPLGGSSSRGWWGKIRSAINYIAVFTFVALWHDLNLRLLMWGWLISLFVLPEVLGMMVFPAKRYRDRPNLYRVICGVGAVGNVLMMMVGNLVGFAIGIDGLKALVANIVGSSGGIAFLVAACATLFVGVQVMFEWREQEKREGIKMKC